MIRHHFDSTGAPYLKETFLASVLAMATSACYVGTDEYDAIDHVGVEDSSQDTPFDPTEDDVQEDQMSSGGAEGGGDEPDDEPMPEVKTFSLNVRATVDTCLSLNVLPGAILAEHCSITNASEIPLPNPNIGKLTPERFLAEFRLPNEADLPNGAKPFSCTLTLPWGKEQDHTDNNHLLKVHRVANADDLHFPSVVIGKVVTDQETWLSPPITDRDQDIKIDLGDACLNIPHSPVVLMVQQEDESVPTDPDSPDFDLDEDVRRFVTATADAEGEPWLTVEFN